MDDNSKSTNDNKKPLDPGAIVHAEGSETEASRAGSTATETDSGSEIPSSEYLAAEPPKPAYVPPITPGEKYQPDGDKKGLAKSIVLLVIGLCLVALGAAGGYYQQHRQVAQKANEIVQLKGKLATANTNDKVASTTKVSTPSGFAAYENKDLGVRFSYPKEWGQVSASSQSNVLSGTFSTNDKVAFGATAQGAPLADRGVQYSDYTGYIQQGEVFYRRTFSVDTENGVKRSFTYIKAMGKSAKLIQAVNTKVLLVDMTNTQLDGPRYEAIVNLNGATYNALNFILKDTSPAALKQFEQMLQTVELTN